MTRSAKAGWNRSGCADRWRRCHWPRTAQGRIVLAVDVSPWLRSDTPTSSERLFCHVYGRGTGKAQLIPGWPYSFVAALDPGRTSWTALSYDVGKTVRRDRTLIARQQRTG